MYSRAVSSPIPMPSMSIRIKLGSRRVSLGMEESWSGAAIQPEAQAPRRGDRVLHLDSHSAYGRGLEPVEFAVADRGAARQLSPVSRVRRPVERVARDALPAGDVLLQPAHADRHRPTQIELGRRTARAGDTPVEGPAGGEIL